MSAAMIEINNLTKIFDGFTALNGLSLHVNKGSIYGLVGINGSGKTTIIKHLAGVYRQDAGSVLIGGAPVYDNVSVKARVGLIPDELYFFQSYTVAGMRGFYKNLYKNWSDERFETLIKLLKLDNKRRLKNFSKGMQKQAAFAFAMSAAPDVLLLDEPIDGLDPIARKIVMQQILDDVAARGMTVLISSHNLKEMEGICDCVGIVKDGRMLIERDLDDLKSSVHKVQVAFSPETPEGPAKYEGLNVLHREKRGSVELLIIKGTEDDALEKIKSLNPLVYDILPLSLEEIFTYETEGDFNEVYECRAV